MVTVVLSVLFLGLFLIALRLHLRRPAVQRRYQVRYERRLAELRLQQVTYAAMRQLLDEARRSR